MQYASKRLRNSKGFMSVCLDGMYLKYASTDLQNDSQLAVLSISNDFSASRFTSKRFAKDVDIIRALAIEHANDTIPWDDFGIALRRELRSYYVLCQGRTFSIRDASTVSGSDKVTEPVRYFANVSSLWHRV